MFKRIFFAIIAGAVVEFLLEFLKARTGFTSECVISGPPPHLILEHLHDITDGLNVVDSEYVYQLLWVELT